jgi:hypothetical protein
MYLFPPFARNMYGTIATGWEKRHFQGVEFTVEERCFSAAFSEK